MHSRRAADVDDLRTSGHPLAHDLLGPLELQQTLSRPADETVTLIELSAVISEHPIVDMLLG